MVGGIAYPLRCGKEDPHKHDVLESTTFEEEQVSGPAAAAAAAAAEPLFAPYTNVLRPLPLLQLQHKYYVAKSLDENDKKSVQRRSIQAEKEFRGAKVMHTADVGAMALAVAEAGPGARGKAAAKTKRKEAPVALNDDGTVKKRTYNRRVPVAVPVPATPVPEVSTPGSVTSALLLTPKAPATGPAAAASPSSLSVASPSMALSPSPSISSDAAAAAPSSAAAAPPMPKLTRSPSTAALPSAATTGEKLRARIAHFLAAQPHGLGMSTLVQRLGVALVDLRATLQAVATYEAPGFYRLRPDVYRELQLDSWPDYSDHDRRRVVDKMAHLDGVHVPQRWALLYGDRSGNGTAGAGIAAPADGEPAMPPPSPPLPPVPDLSQLPDEVPPSMLAAADPSSAGGGGGGGADHASLAAPHAIASYVDYLSSHTAFLDRHRSYAALQSWLDAFESHLCSLRTRAADDAHPPAARRAWLQAADAMETQHAPVRQTLACWSTFASSMDFGCNAPRAHVRLRFVSVVAPHIVFLSCFFCTSARACVLLAVQLVSTCRRKHKVLHLMLSHLKQSLLAYAHQHGLYTVPTILDQR